LRPRDTGGSVPAKKLVVSTYLQHVLIGAAALVSFACEVPAVTDGGKSLPGSRGEEL
jgi:hypothetical protein